MDDVPNRTVIPPPSDPASNRQGEAPPTLTSRDGLLLDFDGTLVELAETPDALDIAGSLIGTLQNLRDCLGGALGVITGRRLESLDRWLAPLQVAGAGMHGSQERLEPGPAPQAAADPRIAAQVAHLRQRYRDQPGVLVEDKVGGIALHYRQAPEQKESCRAALTEVAGALGFALLSGHCVYEARPRGIDKGSALRRLAGNAPFAGRRLFFAGDDTTDEDAIVAVQSLGGIGIRVGEAVTAAHHRLADVAAVHAWLANSLDALRSSAK